MNQVSSKFQCSVIMLTSTQLMIMDDRQNKKQCLSISHWACHHYKKISLGFMLPGIRFSFLEGLCWFLKTEIMLFPLQWAPNRLWETLTVSFFWFTRLLTFSLNTSIAEWSQRVDARYVRLRKRYLVMPLVCREMLQHHSFCKYVKALKAVRYHNVMIDFTFSLLEPGWVCLGIHHKVICQPHRLDPIMALVIADMLVFFILICWNLLPGTCHKCFERGQSVSWSKSQWNSHHIHWRLRYI